MSARVSQSREIGRAPLPLTSRRDAWWIKPLLTVIALGVFGLYGLLRAFENQYFEFGPYLAPFYSPHLPFKLNLFGWNVSPAIYILVFPLTFRLTCYYYRLAYYRAFFWDPPACAVAEPVKRAGYTGERRFPLVLQNLHRYAFYAAVVIFSILVYDTVRSFFWEDGFHIGLGSLLFVANLIPLGLYTFSCHSFRHLIGGRVNCYSCSLAGTTRYGIWKQVSFLNARHSLYAWISLFSVMIADLYVRFLAAGTIQDFRIF
jgi:hypothetical protein